MEFDSDWLTLGRHRLRLRCARGFPTEKTRTVAELARIAIENNLSAAARLVEVSATGPGENAYTITVGTTFPKDREAAIKAFTRYLGVEQSKWTDYDATLLIRRAGRAVFPGGILIDQGLDDKFLEEQLYPETLRAACEIAGQPLRLRKHPGYDHGYYFISSFMEDHLRHHASELGS